MKKYIQSFAILAFCFVWSCRSEDFTSLDLSDTSIYSLDLRSITVEGSTDVTIDRQLGTIQITLPESYSSKSVVLNFTLAQNASLYYNWDGNQPAYSPNKVTPEKQTIEFNYQGTTPIDISILYGENKKKYKIYVNQTGKKLFTDIYLSDSVRYDFYYYFNLRSTKFQGTYPNQPFIKTLLFLLLKSNDTNLVDTVFINPTFWSGYGSFNLRKFYPFGNQKFSVELINNGDRQVLKENFQIFSQTPIIEGIYGFTKISNGLELRGGIFLSSKNYSTKLSNDHLKTPITLNAKVKNANTLIIEPPLSVSPNGYIIEVFEDSKLIYKNILNISETGNPSAIIAIKRENNSTSGQYPSTKKEQLNQGETFSIFSTGTLISCYGVQITQEKLDNMESPSLKLTKNSTGIILSPKKIVVWWAVATCNVVYFQYTIPTSTASGFYEAQLVYPDGRESLKYWNKIEIK